MLTSGDRPTSMSVVEQESISAGHSWAAFYRRLHAAQHRGAAASRVSAGSVPGQSWRADPIAPERRARDLADREHPGTLTLSDLAAAAGLSRHHLVRRFAASYGQTPMRYLAARRLERASDLLRTTELPVLEICLAVGYRSLGSFGRAFLARFGMAPADYRRRMRDPARVPGCFAFMTGAVRDRATSE